LRSLLLLFLPMLSKRVDWRCGMKLGPVERVGAVKQVELARKAADVPPAFGVAEAGRMLDDSYGAHASEQDRGMEEDAPEDEECEPRQESSLEDGEGNEVNIFA